MVPGVRTSYDRRSCFDDPEMLAAARILVAMMSDSNGINVDGRKTAPSKQTEATVLDRSTAATPVASQRNANPSEVASLNTGASKQSSDARKYHHFGHFSGAGPPPPLSPASDQTLRGSTSSGKLNTPVLPSSAKRPPSSPSKFSADSSSDNTEHPSSFGCSSCPYGTFQFRTAEELERHWTQFHKAARQSKGPFVPRPIWNPTVPGPTWNPPRPVQPPPTPRFICYTCVPRASFPFEADLAIHVKHKHGTLLGDRPPDNRPLRPPPPKQTQLFCPMCPESKVSFDSEQGLEGHWARHPDHALTDFSCAVANCRRAFLSEKNLHRHMVEVHG